MKTAKSIPMTRQAVTRIARTATVQNHGQIPARSFATRADAVVQRQEAGNGKGKGN